MDLQKVKHIIGPRGEGKMNRGKLNDVQITILLLILSVAGVGFGLPVLAAPAILVLPGYSLTTALFPAREELAGIDRLLLIFGLNISIVPILALLVNASGFPLFGPGAPLFVALSSATIVFTLISVIRRTRLDQPAWDLKLHHVHIIVIASALLFFFGLLAISSIQEDAPVEFYILDKGGRIHDYYWQEPTSARAGDTLTPEAAKFNVTPVYTTVVDILVVVSNHHGEGQFTVEIGADGEILQVHNFSLKGEESWTQSFKYDASVQSSKEDKVIGFLLYRDNKPIRELHLVIRDDVIEEEP